MKQSYLGAEVLDENFVLREIFEDLVLINLRTYDKTSLILYANDHLNNFVQLYLENGTKVVYMFNYGNEIKNLTVEYAELNTSTSVQIAIERNEFNVTLHVNDKNATLNVGVLLHDEYSHKPWINPEKGKTVFSIWYKFKFWMR